MREPTQTHQSGLLAEWRARLYLRLKGYRIMGKRLHTPVGEIDILAKKGKTWIIAEVKYRKDRETALHAISDQQQKRLINASLWVSKQYNLNQDTPFRFDAILLWGRFRIKHIKNAWQTTEL